MNKAAVYHRADRSMAYAASKDQMQIRLKTAKNDVLKVRLIHGDPYDWSEGKWNYTEESMFYRGSDELHDYWEMNLTPPFHRLRYGFLLSDKKKTVFYGEKSFHPAPPEDIGEYFCLPYMNEADIFKSPEWVHNTVWYQIFPERFANGDASLNPPGTIAWASEDPKRDSFFGGDLQGVIDHLDYLQDLGITGIYFTPVFEASTNHKYDTIDYFEIDQHFGDKDKLKELIQECKKRNIRVMLDAVFNHSGFFFFPFQDVLEKGESSRYKDWFHIWDFPVQTKPEPNYDTFAFTYMMPKLNTEHPEVKNYLLEAARYWAREFEIDGWRLDVANEVDQAFWREFRQEVKNINPDLYILGEVWHDSIPWLQGDQFDAVMNYPFTNNALQLIAKRDISIKTFIENMTKVKFMYPSPVNKAAFNLVGSHDTPRILTECDHELERVKQVFTLLLTYYGTPCIYYGDEVGLTGGGDPGCRKCMEWDEEKQNQELLSFTKKLIQLRKDEPLLANEGDLSFYDLSEQTLILKRENHDSAVIILINLSDKKDTVKIPYSLNNRKTIDLMTEEAHKWKKGKIKLRPQEIKLIKVY
ncbi:glycoside hydrolase family 13 protein [Jeotgalibacillus terrae]|uniref:Glycoside hydrolase family 13 protein n=1 Tax=Jeotgalibacillus terrae TaxID=587735 RepID=A0ABW5ZHB7_9BACL|nr:glycoside hydrolase family 13 protein [Jeotgalibacillus terrae]MBM7579778.1 glycosidase [Jeotgalibacillus terrae]